MFTAKQRKGKLSRERETEREREIEREWGEGVAEVLQVVKNLSFSRPVERVWVLVECALKKV